MPISSSVPTGALSTAEPCFAQPQVPLKKKFEPSLKIYRHFTLLYCSGCGGGLGNCRCRYHLSLALLGTSSEVLNKSLRSKLLIFLWRIIKRFNFKLPHYVPPVEVPLERDQEPFVAETPPYRSVPPFPRTPSSPSSPPEVFPKQSTHHPPPQYISTPTFSGPLVDNNVRTVYTPMKRNYSQVIYL